MEASVPVGDRLLGFSLGTQITIDFATNPFDASVMPDQSSTQPSRARWLIPLVVFVVFLNAAPLLLVWGLWQANLRSDEQVAIGQLTSEGDGVGEVIYDWEYDNSGDEEGPPGDFVTKVFFGENYASHAVHLETYGRSAETLAKSLGHLRKLQSVKLVECEFNKEVAQALAGLPELTTIQFATMSPSAESLEVLSQGKQIEELNLLNTQVTDAQLAAIGKFTNLNSLYIAESIGSDEGLAKLGQLRSLLSLTIYAMPQITDDGVAELKNLTKLEGLTLPPSQITGRSLAIITQMPQLNDLEMTCLPSKQDAKLPTAEIWSQVPELSSITLDAPCIDDEDLAEMAKLPTLYELYLCNPGITDSGVAKLAQAQELSWLTLLGTHISDEGIRPLAKLPGLAYVEISSDQEIFLDNVGDAEVDYSIFDPKFSRPHLPSPYEDY